MKSKKKPTPVRHIAYKSHLRAKQRVEAECQKQIRAEREKLTPLLEGMESIFHAAVKNEAQSFYFIARKALLAVRELGVPVTALSPVDMPRSEYLR